MPGPEADRVEKAPAPALEMPASKALDPAGPTFLRDLDEQLKLDEPPAKRR